MIPMTQDIKVSIVGEPDIWGKPEVLEERHLKGNLRSHSKIIIDQNGKEVVSEFTILFKGFVKMTVHDFITFTEPNDVTIESNPIQVKFMRDLSGKVAFTRVNL